MPQPVKTYIRYIHLIIELILIWITVHLVVEHVVMYLRLHDRTHAPHTVLLRSLRPSAT